MIYGNASCVVKNGYFRTLAALDDDVRRVPVELPAGKTNPGSMNIAFRAGTGGLHSAEN
ncbi:MAG: hypothetical protein WCH99_20250 [Verrucomicrobiota bacterium]